MITVISGTNRKNNFSQIFAKYCHSLASEMDNNATFLNFTDIAEQFDFSTYFDFENNQLFPFVKDYLRKNDKWIIVFPEYNGSFPGILKLFIDGIHPSEFKGKKIALVGVSAGRAGNLRGLDQLTSILHHLGAEVLGSKPKLSGINGLVTENEVSDANTKEQLSALVEKLRNF